LVLKGGRVVDPASGLDATMDLVIADGCIEAINPARRASSAGKTARGTRVLDVRGKIVTPGLVDMHVHLRDPGQEHKEVIETGTRAAAAGGFTSVACMPNTDPPNDGLALTEYIVAEARRRGVVNVFPIGCVSKGSRGEDLAEIGDMVRGGIVAVSDDGHPVGSSRLMRQALEYTTMFDIPVIDHCEDRSLSAGGVMHEGRVSTVLGLKGIPAAAEEVSIDRNITLARLTGGRLHLAHLSTRGSVERVRAAKREGVPITCEVTPHHLLLTDEAVRESGYDANTKMNPPLRCEKDRQAVLAAVADGTIDAIASDHAPHHVDEKMREFDAAPFGIIGLETVVPLMMDRLVNAGLIDMTQLVTLLALNPARILRIDRGFLKEGASADVTVIDPDLERAVDVDRFQSRSRNCPFNGWSLRGWPVTTIVGGRVVYELDEAASD
jgi:dihydroorotase